jgi:glycolate oxidase iron-sulfur subunit
MSTVASPSPGGTTIESIVDRGTHGVHKRGIFTPELLDQCIGCGFCLPVCPTYAETGIERFSPRGRISLMRALEAGTLDADDPTLFEQSSACLGCRACEPVCPAGVQYGQLLEEWRDHQWRGRHRPLIARGLMLLVRWALPLRLQGLVRRYAKSPRRGALDPHSGEAIPQPGVSEIAAPPEPASLMLGCVERGLYPSVSRSATQLCSELQVPANQGCCGALHAHNGDKHTGERMAEELGRRLPGAIVTTAGGCAAHLAEVLGRDRVKEFSQYLVETGRRSIGELRVGDRRARVTLQDSCHLRVGLGVTQAPRELLAQVADFVELPESASCCGAAGSYSLLERARSRRIRDARIEAIERLGVDLVVWSARAASVNWRPGYAKPAPRCEPFTLPISSPPPKPTS